MCGREPTAGRANLQSLFPRTWPALRRKASGYDLSLPGGRRWRARVALGVSADSNGCVAVEIAALEESQDPAAGRRSRAIAVGVATQMAEAVAHFRATSRPTRCDAAARVAIDEVDVGIAGAVAASAPEGYREQGCEPDPHR